MRRLIPALLLWVASQCCQASPPAADGIAIPIRQRLEQIPVLRAEFTQEKRMAAFKKPLVTRGHFSLIRGRGVAWKIDAPLKLVYVMSENQIREIAEDGKPVTRNAQEVPGIGQAARVFRALIGADVQALSTGFTITQEGTPEAWRFNLAPKPGPLAQFMRQVRIAGSRYVDRVVIEETNGDMTTIVFRGFIEHDAPSTEERAWFGTSQ